MNYPKPFKFLVITVYFVNSALFVKVIKMNLVYTVQRLNLPNPLVKIWGGGGFQTHGENEKIISPREKMGDLMM